MDKIRVVDVELHACAAAYLKSLETLRGAVATYQKSLQALSSDWTGRAFLIMSAKVADLTAKIVKSYDRVIDAVSELGEVESIFTENESEIKGMVSNLDAGTRSPFGG